MSPQPLFQQGSAPGDKNLAWFCLRSQTKHEHIAAAHLKKMEEMEVFLPRIRFQRATRQGPAWVTEALFPGYFFARFDQVTSLRRAWHAPGVKGIVHFGDYWPTISDAFIQELRQTLGASDLHTISQDFASGDTVQIVGGALRGMRAVIAKVVPGRERVAVLMELLGQETMIEMASNSVIREGDQRRTVLSDRKLF